MTNKNININMPIKVGMILEVLESSGFEAYIVGGCVRDSLLGRQPHDWDITTNAKPSNVINIFKETGFKVIETGLKHGTVTVMINNEGFEVTTYRIDGDYSDNRHPDKVEFTNNLKEDLSRRDFTVNAMAYNDENGLIDYFGGLIDLENSVIKCVRNAEARFKEDALRMLRAVRFSAQLGFKIENETSLAIQKNDKLIQNVSQERIQSELNKILISDNPNYIGRLYNYELLDDIIPEYADCFECSQVNPYHIYNVGIHIEKSLSFIESKLSLRLTMLFHDMGKPICKSTDELGINHFYAHAEKSSELAEIILKRLKYDNDTIDKVKVLVKYHDVEISSDKQIRRLLNKVGEENLKDLLKVREADIKAQNLQYYEKRHKEVLFLKDRLDYVIQENNCFQLKDLAISGKDLISLGFEQGKEIGNRLNDLLDIVLDNPELNTKEYLIEYVNKMKERK